MPPETRYAQSGEVNIAYQVIGDGPTDLIFVPGFVSHLDLELAGRLSNPEFLGRMVRLMKDK